MLRALFISTSFALSMAALPAYGAAHPEPAPAKTAKKAAAKTAPQALNDIKLPSQSEIDALVKNMPDMNALMGQMMTVMKDPALKDSMQRSGKAFAEKMENSGALEPTGSDGMPDFNKAFGAMLSMMSDEEAMGGLLGALGTMAQGLEDVELNLGEAANAPAKKPGGN